jgi:acetylornithine deacetylase
MNVFELTRVMVDIESLTGNEKAMGEYVADYLRPLAAGYGGNVEIMPVEANRFNVFASFGNPVATLSTHLDTVPPYFSSREDDEFIHGRGACDVKGIIAAMLKAAEALLAEGERDFGLLFVVGEERNSAGAYAAAKNPRGSRFLVNGEPTSNRLALGSKGALRYEIVARGRMAHSAYPELGESAIDKLLSVLAKVRHIPMPVDPLLGAGTLNIGTLTGGRAPNVIADYAEASVMIRLVDDAAPLQAEIDLACQGMAEPRQILCVPAVRLGALDGFETTVVSYTTDIPAFGGAWGRPLLIGPGTIHVAHTENERVPKQELVEAIDLYRAIVKRLKSGGMEAIT